MQPPLNDTQHIEEPTVKPNFFTETKSLFQTYIGDRISLVKLQAIEKVSVLSAAIVSGILLFLLSLFFLLSFTITLGFLFGRLVHSNWQGFAIVTGVYFLLILIVIFFGKKLFGNTITHKIIRSFLKKK